MTARRLLLLALTAVAAGCTTLGQLMAEPTLTAAELNAVEAAAGCAVVPVSFGASTAGELGSGGCFGGNRDGIGDPYSGGYESYRWDGQVADYYAFYYQSNPYRGRVEVRLSSDAFDGYLLLLNKEGRVIAQDDDGGGRLDPRILRALPDGVYLVAVTSRRPGERGAYSLRTGSMAPIP